MSEKAKAALERCRSVHEQYRIGFGPFITNNEVVLIVNEMLRLFPVKTLNGVVIRWDDEITPERLVASGWRRGDWHYDTYKNDMCGLEMIFRSHIKDEVKHTSVQLIDDERDSCIPNKYQPTNMNEVWTLMAKCGCPAGGGE